MLGLTAAPDSIQLLLLPWLLGRCKRGWLGSMLSPSLAGGDRCAALPRALSTCHPATSCTRPRLPQPLPGAPWNSLVSQHGEHGGVQAHGCPAEQPLCCCEAPGPAGEQGKCEQPQACSAGRGSTRAAAQQGWCGRAGGPTPTSGDELLQLLKHQPLSCIACACPRGLCRCTSAPAASAPLPLEAPPGVALPAQSLAPRARCAAASCIARGVVAHSQRFNPTCLPACRACVRTCPPCACACCPRSVMHPATGLPAAAVAAPAPSSNSRWVSGWGINAERRTLPT